MARVTVEDCLDHCFDQFALVHLASSRYRHLSKGAPSLVPQGKNKLIVTSLREIASGKVKFRDDIEAALLKARQEESMRRQQALEAARAADEAGNDADPKALMAF
ncbi:MAG: DNA-directed RNA polymerase subunit omega [Bradymonadia bacterium]